MVAQSTEPPARAGNKSRQTTIAILLVVSVLAGFVAFVLFFERSEELQELSGDQETSLSRKVDTVYRDVEQSWQQWFLARDMQPPKASRKVLYTRARPSPCAGAVPASGPFYCPVDRTAAFDLVFINALENQMYRDKDMATALVVARVLSSHVQDALDTANSASRSGNKRLEREYILQADCLTGVWAGMAAGRLGVVPKGFFGRLIGTASELGDQNQKNGNPALNIFLPGSDVGREKAFQRGVAAVDPQACMAPG